METTPTVLFLCPHAAAKSLIAATYGRVEIARRGLDLAIATGGADPDDAPSPVVVAALAAEGFDVATHRPSRVTTAQLEQAAAIVSLGCEDALLAPYATKVERWDDVPPASVDVTACQSAIQERLTRFLDGLAAERAELDRWTNEGGAS